MHLDNVVIDTQDHRAAARFWSALLDAPLAYEDDHEADVRLGVGERTLDLCFVPVPEAVPLTDRLHLDVAGGVRQDEVVRRALGLGAAFVDLGQQDVPWVVLGDPSGRAFCVMEERGLYRGRTPVAALPLDVEAGRRKQAAAWWTWATGWEVVEESDRVTALSDPIGQGPLLELCVVERVDRARKSSMHLDVRLDPGDDRDALVAEAVERGAGLRDHDWGDLPWVVLTDPSGLEVCLLGRG